MTAGDCEAALAPKRIIVQFCTALLDRHIKAINATNQVSAGSGDSRQKQIVHSPASPLPLSGGFSP